LIEGLLALYPTLSSKIEVLRVPFARPRKKVIEVVGVPSRFVLKLA
jgi:hypothetical protein